MHRAAARLGLAFALTATLAGCASDSIEPTPTPPDRSVSGSAAGSSAPSAVNTQSNSPIWRTRFAWATGDLALFAAGATITFVKGLTPQQALAILYPHPATPLETPSQAQAWADRQPYQNPGPNAQVVAARSRDGWTIVLEPNGYEATVHPTELSKGGTAVIIYNNVNFNASFQYARGGHLLRAFDPVVYDSLGPGSPLPQEQGIGFGDGQGADFIAQCLFLAQRLTGLEALPTDQNVNDYQVAVGVMV